LAEETSLADAVREHLAPLLINTIALILVVVVTEMVVPALASLGTAIPGVGVSVSLVVTVAAIVVALYLVYRILAHLKEIVMPAADLVSELILGEKDEGVKSGIENVLLAVVAIVAAVMVSPLVVPIPGVGAILSIGILAVGLGVGGLLLIKGGTQLLKAFKSKIDEFVESVAERVEEIEERVKESEESAERSEE